MRPGLQEMRSGDDDHVHNFVHIEGREMIGACFAPSHLVVGKPQAFVNISAVQYPLKQHRIDVAVDLRCFISQAAADAHLTRRRLLRLKRSDTSESILKGTNG
jgi:hypothetical protein